MRLLQYGAYGSDLGIGIGYSMNGHRKIAMSARLGLENSLAVPNPVGIPFRDLGEETFEIGAEAVRQVCIELKCRCRVCGINRNGSKQRIRHRGRYCNRGDLLYVAHR